MRPRGRSHGPSATTVFGVALAVEVALTVGSQVGRPLRPSVTAYDLIVVSAAVAGWLVILACLPRIARRSEAAASREDIRLDTGKRVARVVTDRQLDMVLQPIIDLESGRPVGAEALARFADGRSPELWFGEARSTGRSLELDHLAFASALRAQRRLPPDCYLSVNAEPALLTSGILLDEIAKADVDCHRLVIELTEHVKVQCYAQLQDELAAARARGVRLAIDDTGAGYASFNHVLQLQPEIIKVDRSLVSNIAADPARRSLVTSLVLLALDLRASVVAEGVETQLELDMVASLGVDCAQGYLLGPPSHSPEVLCPVVALP